MPALVGIFCFSKFKDSIVKYFIYFLWYAAIMQTIGTYTVFVQEYQFLKPLKQLITGSRFEKNYWFFTLFWSIAAALFYSSYFHHILSGVLQKRTIKIATILFVISSVIYLIKSPDDLFNSSITFIKIFGALVILTGSIFYFLEVLKSELVLTFYKSIHFFISATLFVWWLVITPVSFFEVYFSASDWDFVFLKWQIFLFMNFFMYLTFAFAFIWCKQEHENLIK